MANYKTDELSRIPATMTTLEYPEILPSARWVGVMHRHDNTPAPTCKYWRGASEDQVLREAGAWCGGTFERIEDTDK